MDSLYGALFSLFNIGAKIGLLIKYGLRVPVEDTHSAWYASG